MNIQIINKLQYAAPNFNDHVANKYKIEQNDDDDECDKSIEINKEKRDEFAYQRKQNRQSYIYYSLDKLREERNDIQQQIRHQLRYKPKMNYTTEIYEERKDTDLEDKNFVDVNDDDVEQIDHVTPIPIHDVNNNVENQNKNENKSVDVSITDTIIGGEIHQIESLDAIGKQSVYEANDRIPLKEAENKSISLAVIDEHKEKIIDNMDEEERDRLEREKLEEELMDDNIDYAQSESFSGIDYMHNDFLEQYQRHIENMTNS